MTLYKATNEETGEVVEGGSRDLAKIIGTTQKNVINASCEQRRIRNLWRIEKYKTDSKPGPNIPVTLAEDWDRATAPYKALIARKRGIKKGSGKIRLRTMYNVGVY